MVTQPLATLEEATRMLAECRTVDEAKKVRDLAEAARVYAREADLGAEAQNYAAEIKLRAERRCGEILAEMAVRGARAHGGNNKQESLPTIPDLGVTPSESSRWQRLADADPEAFEQYISEAQEAGTPISTAGAIRHLTPDEKREREDRAAELFAIYRAIEAIATCGMSPKKWAKLDHGASRYRVDQHLEAAMIWLQELGEIWQTV